MSDNGTHKRKVTGKTVMEPGLTVVTPGAAEVMKRHGLHPLVLLARHVSGDWGDLPVEDAVANEQALKDEARVMSVYKFGADTLWVITEADRSSTTILTPGEY